MKKFLAILFSIVILATFMAVPALAEKSPEGEVIHKVEIKDEGKDDGGSDGSDDGGSSSSTIVAVVDGDTITLKVEDEEAEFISWVINGEYEIVSGSLTSKEIVIRPKTDLEIEAKYKDTSSEDKDENDSDKAPQTGNGALMFTVLLTAGAFAVMLATKKAVKA